MPPGKAAVVSSVRAHSQVADCKKQAIVVQGLALVCVWCREWAAGGLLNKLRTFSHKLATLSQKMTALAHLCDLPPRSTHKRCH